MSAAKPSRIQAAFYPKVWGSTRLSPWFPSGAPPSGDPTGEVWFPAGHLLIKFLFTEQNLSVQVHPSDDYARIHENSLGKTEMWHILRADPGASIAVGLKEPLTAAELIPAAQSGEIMDLLNWIEVSPGETYFIPAGTIHAIGAGLALCEIQQNSDVTYRLYDYGRARELHLRQAAEVSVCAPHPGKAVPRDLGNGLQLLVDSPYFKTFGATVTGPVELAGRFLITLEGTGKLDGQMVQPGQVWEAGESKQWKLEPDGTSGSMRILITG